MPALFGQKPSWQVELRLGKWIHITPQVALGFFAGYMTCMFTVLFLHMHSSSRVVYLPDGRDGRTDSFSSYTDSRFGALRSGGLQEQRLRDRLNMGGAHSRGDYDDVGADQFHATGARARGSGVAAGSSVGDLDYSNSINNALTSDDYGGRKSNKIVGKEADMQNSLETLTIGGGDSDWLKNILSNYSTESMFTEWRKRALVQQGDYCLHEKVTGMPGTQMLKFDAFTMNVYVSRDYISESLIRTGTWENKYLSRILRAMGATVNGKRTPDPLFVDVGANVGWFAFSVGSQGYRVAAFEVLPDNVALMRSSLCNNPVLVPAVEIYDFGLSSNNRTCFAVSNSKNNGDAHVLCSVITREEADRTAAAMEPAGYEVKGEVLARRLDEVLAEDIQVLKVDVEGHELNVLLGAQRLINKYNVWFILVNFNLALLNNQPMEPSIAGGHPGIQLMVLLDKLGYQLSFHSFAGPWLDASQIIEGFFPEGAGENLFCRKNTYRP